MDKPRIGFIGLGRMGAPMSQRLLAAGYPLTVHDLRQEAIAAAGRAGAEAGGSPAEVAGRTDVVITMLPDANAVEQVVYGDGGLLRALRSGQFLLEMTSSRPRVTGDHSRSCSWRSGSQPPGTFSHWPAAGRAARPTTPGIQRRGLLP